ncbi:hypothetical protein CEXT_74461 [Caerostris extrusa]|uniref:Uncharacterized protein n=1 Tax=Caerostris extrusa TaxID=172846 RepID=A0AAV4VFY5_CAEEX|nr:hypothetical protein CEXT_74461 [Caerostris extrusa]
MTFASIIDTLFQNGFVMPDCALLENGFVMPDYALLENDFVMPDYALLENNFVMIDEEGHSGILRMRFIMKSSVNMLLQNYCKLTK